MSESAGRGRLFVPLRTEHFRNFERGEKDVELRGHNDQFNMETVVPGRVAELRRGYSTDDSLWGVIEHVCHHQHLTNIAEDRDHTRILPDSTREEFEQSVRQLLGDYSQFISFQVGCISRPLDTKPAPSERPYGVTDD